MGYTQLQGAAVVFSDARFVYSLIVQLFSLVDRSIKPTSHALKIPLVIAYHCELASFQGPSILCPEARILIWCYRNLISIVLCAAVPHM
jgi:hypothetical protein